MMEARRTVPRREVTARRAQDVLTPQDTTPARTATAAAREPRRVRRAATALDAHSSSARSLTQRAKAQLLAAHGHHDPVRLLGGSARVCTLLALSSLDSDGDGQLSEDEAEQAKSLVEATLNSHLNVGVVAALVLSVLFPLAYEEKSTLADLAISEHWGTVEWSDLTSFVAVQLAISASAVSVFMSSRMYAQVSFWLPSLEARLWYISISSSTTTFLETIKNFTLFATLLSLGLETAVSATWLDTLAFSPIVLLTFSWVVMEMSLSRQCSQHLAIELRARVNQFVSVRNDQEDALKDMAC
ncbi:hypothetical protein AB1Y20_021428 [Prymnesium parvum]|uniref:EF-hand domain-containing protein n=1 Tax=Prymnesium parvum TaxID=97485 RepID=A0AB34JI87_PRYPA